MAKKQEEQLMSFRFPKTYYLLLKKLSHIENKTMKQLIIEGTLSYIKSKKELGRGDSYS